jgi:hypothetical protein
MLNAAAAAQKSAKVEKTYDRNGNTSNNRRSISDFTPTEKPDVMSPMAIASYKTNSSKFSTNNITTN